LIFRVAAERPSSPVITKLLYVDGSEKVHRGAADRLGELFGA
jgi:hypothetical protein